MRLATFNLMSGRSLSDGLISPALVEQAADVLDADVLAVQEADRYQERSGLQDQAAAMAAAMGATAWRFEEAVLGVPGVPGWAPGRHTVAEDDRSAGYGVALLSRIPVDSWHVLRLAPGRGWLPIVIPSRPPRLLWMRDEPRVVLAAVLTQPRMTVGCTHLSFMPLRAARHLIQVRRWLSELPAPRVLMGDLNLPGGVVRTLMPGWKPLIEASTFPSPRPRIQLDHVLAHGLSPDAMVAGRVTRMPISDHCAVTADLNMG